MKPLLTLLLISLLSNLTLADETPKSYSKKRCASKLIEYPKYPELTVVDRVQGREIPDPFRGLEDTTSEATQNWVNAQNRLTSRILSPTLSTQKKIIQKFEKYYAGSSTRWLFTEPSADASKPAEPQKFGNYYYYKQVAGGFTSTWKISRTTNKAKLGEGEVIFSSHRWSAAVRHFVQLSDVEIVQDGKYMIAEIAKFGSDWSEIFIIDLETGKEISHIEWTKGGYSLSSDEKSILYSQYPTPDRKYVDGNRRGHIMSHTIGQPEIKDQLVYYDKDLRIGELGAYYVDETKQIIVDVIDPRHKGNAVLVRSSDLKKKEEFRVLIPHSYESDFHHALTDEKSYWFITNYKAKNRRIIQVPKNSKSENDWLEVIGESADGYLEGIHITDQYLILDTVMNGVSVPKIFGHDGKFIRDLPSPGPGSIFNFRRKTKAGLIVFDYNTLIDPGTTYAYDLRKDQLIKLTPDNPKSPLNDYVYEHTTYKSKDGTEVPIQLLYHKDTKRDGTNPVYLHAYGGFGVNMLPDFNDKLFLWAKMGGIVAVPNIRGGAEMGGIWHEDGSGLKKQNSFDDFIAAAEWLIRENWTTAKKIGIEGGSNGGLLIAACVLQRPDLFGAALSAVGVHDMIRFQKFTRGFHWINEYGSLRFREAVSYMLGYSPVQNVKPGVEYPPMIISTGNKDDRVAPVHSFKLAAAMQKAQKGPNPILLRVNANSAHGPGTRLEYVKQMAEELAFFMEYLGFEPKSGSLE